MGFVGFLRFSILCFDFLAWPAFALGYPLWASIQAIEAGSKYHMKKLITYWTAFSIIALFDCMFAKLVEWLPLWPYVKLVVICWLIIPHFDGAYRVYECLIRPCLSLNLQNITKSFCKTKENISMKKTFLAPIETFLEENRSEAPEKLFASQAKCEELPVSDAQEVVKGVEPSVQHATATEQLVKHSQPDLVENIPAVREEKRAFEILVLKKPQQEWTCAMCQVTATSETDLYSHLRGRKHKLKCVELNVKQTAKNMHSPALKPNDSNQANVKQTAKNMHSPALKPNDSNQANEKSMKNPKKNDKLLCRICNIRCYDEINLAAHIKGRKHLNRLKSINNLLRDGKA